MLEIIVTTVAVGLYFGMIVKIYLKAKKEEQNENRNYHNPISYN